MRGSSSSACACAAVGGSAAHRSRRAAQGSRQAARAAAAPQLCGCRRREVPPATSRPAPSGRADGGRDVYGDGKNAWNLPSFTKRISTRRPGRLHPQKGRGKMKMTAQEYARRVQKAGPHSPLLADCLWAFCVGGGICLLGEGLRQLFLRQGADAEAAGTLTSCTFDLALGGADHAGLVPKLAAKAGAGRWYPSPALPTRWSVRPLSSRPRDG